MTFVLGCTIPSMSEYALMRTRKMRNSTKKTMMTKRKLKMDNDAMKAVVSIVLSLGSLIAGLVFLGLGTNLYIALAAFFLIMYVNSTRD